ncbi:MAG TPA: tyrosine-protein phosphatase [Dermatophilaceae bacterium]|nr:tyrosine-protein phosphatase [Dermatophilaceae bacterium]
MAPTDLDWSGCSNARDLGGLPGSNGFMVRARALVRADDLTRLDAAGRRSVDGYDPALILDLRFGFELEDEPHPYTGHAAYRHLPFLPQSVVDDADEEAARQHPLEWTYGNLLDASPATVAAGVRAVVEAPPGPVVVHCVSGKDRTGLLVALLLDLVGVDRALIGADYAASERRLGVEEMLASMSPDERAAAERFWRTPESAVIGALEHVDRTYGGTRGYLRSAGLSDTELDLLADRLVQPPT